jgi:TRAP-type C4-dicarboxylate transport system permease small subunit
LGECGLFKQEISVCSGDAAQCATFEAQSKIMHSLLDSLAKACAIVGGLVMAAITLMTTGSVVGRYIFSKPLLGDTEAVQFGMALAVAAFLPMCQWKSGNIIVDFFTTRARDSTKRVMDAFGAVLIAVMVGVLSVFARSRARSARSPQVPPRCCCSGPSGSPMPAWCRPCCSPL